MKKQLRRLLALSLILLLLTGISTAAAAETTVTVTQDVIQELVMNHLAAFGDEGGYEATVKIELPVEQLTFIFKGRAGISTAADKQALWRIIEAAASGTGTTPEAIGADLIRRQLLLKRLDFTSPEAQREVQANIANILGFGIFLDIYDGVTGARDVDMLESGAWTTVSNAADIAESLATAGRLSAGTFVLPGVGTLISTVGVTIDVAMNDTKNQDRVELTQIRDRIDSFMYWMRSVLSKDGKALTVRVEGTESQKFAFEDFERTDTQIWEIDMNLTMAQMGEGTLGGTYTGSMHVGYRYDLSGYDANWTAHWARSFASADSSKSWLEHLLTADNLSVYLTDDGSETALDMAAFREVFFDMSVNKYAIDIKGLASRTTITRHKWTNQGRDISGGQPVSYNNDDAPWNNFTKYVRITVAIDKDKPL